MFSYELNDFVVPPVLISDMAGGAVSEYNLGTSYIFHIEFAETAEAQWEYFYDEQAGEYHLIYQLPPEIKIPLQIEEENPYPIWGLPSMPGQPPPIVGHYNVFTDGSVKVHFDNVDIYGNSVAPTNFIDYYTDASFTMEIIAQFAHVGTQQVIDFGNNAIITVDVLNPIDGKLDVRKTYATFDLRNENMTFTIAVTAQDDEVHDITITDFNPIGDNLNKAIFKAMTVSVQGGAAYTPPEFTALDGQLFGDGFTLAFPAITLQPGEQIIVEFTLNFTDLIVELTSGGQSTAGTFEYSIYVNNAAFAEGIDSDLTPVISETFIVRNILLSRDFFRKSAHTDLTNDYTAYWDNIRVGDGVTPLNDATISDNFDEMFFVGTYVEFSLQDTNNITIARWRKPIGPNTSDFSITLPDETEAVLAETRPDGTVVTPLRTGQYGEIVYVYISTYSTIVADPTADFENTYTRRYTNRLGVSIGGENPFIEVTAGIVKSGAFPEASKVNEYVYSDGAPIGIQWTVTTVIPASCYGENVNFFDDVWVNVYESDIWTRYYLFDPQPFREMTVEASDESGTRELIEGVDYTLNTPASGGWRMYFVGQNSPSPFSVDTVLTFTYTIPLDAIVAHGGLQMTMKEALQSFERAEIDYQSNSQNWFYLYNPMSLFVGVAGGALVVFTDIRWPVHKIATEADGIVKYRVYINSADMLFLYSNILRDSFDENVEYVPYSFNVMPDGGGGKRYGPYQSPLGDFVDMLAESIVGNEFQTDFTVMRHINIVDGLATGFASTEMLYELVAQNTYYIVEYQMSVREGLIDQHILENTAEVNGFDHSAEAVYGNKVVDKSMVTASNLAAVTIVINPDEAQLAEDGKYTIIDTQNDNLAFYLGTVMLSAWNGFAWIPMPLTNSDSGELWTWMLIGSNELHIVVPDETRLLLTYTALIRGEAGQTVDIFNSIRVAEEYTDYIEESFYIEDTHGSSGGERRYVAVLKNDADDPMIFLFGSVFALYVGYPFAGWEDIPLPPGVERSFLVGQTTFYFLAMETSVADGAVFDNAWRTPTHGFIYAVVELEPPEGYELPDDPITLFAYTPPTPQQLEDLGEKGSELLQISDNITISNTRADFEPIFVDLLMNKNAIGGPMVGGEFNFAIFDEDGIQVNFATNNQVGLITFPGMEFSEPGFYEFTVRETFAPPGWVRDEREWPIIIEIIYAQGELQAIVSYPEGIPGFVNNYQGEQCGLIEFPCINFDAPGIYEFTLRELTPSGGGWTTDDSEIPVIVEVVEDEHGNLIATISYPDGFPTFTNTYTPTTVCFVPSARKTAVGAPLPCARFRFGLFNEAGELIDSATNGSIPA